MSIQKPFAPILSVLSASVVVLVVGMGSEAAYAQNVGNRGAGAMSQPPMTAQRPASPGSQALTRMPQRAQDRIPQQARDSATPRGGTRPDAAQDGLAKASEKAADQAKEVAAPLGGSLPEQAQQGLEKATEKAPEEARAVAAPLGGDPVNAGKRQTKH